MSTPRQRSALLRGAAVGAVLLAGVVVVATVRAPSAASPAALAAAPEACSFELCEASGCDAALNPHLCVATGGCSATPWSAKGCSGETCSLGACDQQAPDDRAGSCEHVACPAARCAPDAQQRCGATQPFQCLGGSANLGCSADAFGWVLVVETMCAACCDTRSCATAAAPSGGDPAGTG
mmetsp:Transcript_23085/g.71356  ORF Transcript_23085/g.71356 Transcript_23085/m.71356 type:complete len:180 (+) Transcript_23085:407-946(+)